VRDISFTVNRHECLAIVGESGSGKSVTARALVGLTGGRSRVTARRLELSGLDLTALTEQRWRAVRGRRAGPVLQDALVSLDPLRTVGAEIAEVLRTHKVVPRAELRQRALIASALAGGPELLLADEPTTALDVTVQAQVLDLLRRLQDGGTSLLLISHDLAVVARLADRIAVMYEGLVVEEGPADHILGDPRHPYTRGSCSPSSCAFRKAWTTPPASTTGCERLRERLYPGSDGRARCLFPCDSVPLGGKIIKLGLAAAVLASLKTPSHFD
jgi:peptide/nickel transport system ATP-binding protein